MKGKKLGIIFGIFSSVVTLGMATLMTLCLTGQTNIIKKMCTVTFRDEDYRILGKVDVKQGEDAKFPLPKFPEKAKNDRNQFKFSTWLPVPNNVMHDMTCFAVYISTDDINEMSSWAEKLPSDVDIKADVNIGGFEDAPIVTVKSNLGNRNYLRCNSFGDFSNLEGDLKKTFLSTPFKYTTFDSKKPFENPVNYTAKLAKSYVGPERMTIKYNDLVFSAADKLPIKINLPVPQYNVIDPEKMGVTYSDCDIYGVESVKNNEYQTMALNLSYSPKELAKLKQNSSGLTIEEAQRRDQYDHYVNNTYKQVCLEHAQLLNDFIEENGINRNSRNVMIEAISALQKFATLDKEIVKTPNSFPGDFVKYFLTTNPRGNEQQFTIIATLLLRQLGIPTRAVVGLAFDNMMPGVEVPLSFDAITTWTECYIEQVGWVLVDPVARTPEPDEEADPDGGKEPPKKEQLTIHYRNIDREYNAEYVTEEEIKKLFTVTGKKSKDHHLKVDLIDFNEVRNVGKYEFDVKLSFVDLVGKDVSKFYNFSKPTLDYYVNIKPREIQVTTPTVELDYGESYTLPTYDIEIHPSILPGHNVEFEEIKTFSEPGSYVNYVVISKIFDDFGEDVSSNYVLHYVYGAVDIY